MNSTHNSPPLDELTAAISFIEEYGHGAGIITVEPNGLVFKAPIGCEQTITYTGHSYAYQQWGRSPSLEQALTDSGFSVPGSSRHLPAASDPSYQQRNWNSHVRHSATACPGDRCT